MRESRKISEQVENLTPQFTRGTHFGYTNRAGHSAHSVHYLSRQLIGFRVSTGGRFFVFWRKESMGMFDYIKCKYPLPGTKPHFVTSDSSFQTKDLECMMDSYEITEDGRIVQTSACWNETLADLSTFTGEINFGICNASVSAAGHTFTPDGSPFEDVDYKALFVQGRITNIMQTNYETRPALPRAVYEQSYRKESEIEKPLIDESEPTVGAEMFIQFGGGTPGFTCTLIGKTDRKYALATADGDIETMDKSDLGHLLFHTAKDSQTYTRYLRDKRNASAAYFNEMATSKS